jgi:ribosome biogenesis protein NSA1
MRILTGDECGLFKETIPERCRPKQADNLNPNNKTPWSTLDGVRRVDPNEAQRRARGVIGMSFTSTDSSSFAALRANGTIQLWESTRDVPKESFGSYQCTGVVPNVFETAGSSRNEALNAANNNNIGRPVALDSFVQKERLCAADSLGNIAIITTKASSPPSVVATYSPFSKQQQQQQTLSYTKGSYANTTPCTAMAVDQYHGRVALSGRERETRLLEMSTGQVVWKAKNLPPDPQTLLQQPVWSTALAFFDESTMAVGTAFRQVRLYDVRTDSNARRRPMAHTPDGVFSHRITALCPVVDEHQLVVGDAAGYLHLLDVRSLGNQQQQQQQKKKPPNVARLVGPAGSIRQVVKHASMPMTMIATVGLDRMLRTFCLKKRCQVDCVYMKQRLNCVLFCNDDTWNAEEKENEHVVEEYQGENDDVDAEDEVQDYIDSSGDEQDEDSNDDSDEQSEKDSNEDSQEEESDDVSKESDKHDESDASSDLEEADATRRRDFKRQKRV